MFTGKETGIDPGGRGNPHMISRDLVDQFGALLRDHEKSNATIEKYTRDVRTFIAWLEEADAAEAAEQEQNRTGYAVDRETDSRDSIPRGTDRDITRTGHAVDRETVRRFKHYLKENYRITSANSMLSALNTFFKFMGWQECSVMIFKTQRVAFRSTEKDLSVEEYQNLVRAARSRTGRGEACGRQLGLIIETLAGTGIRVSELPFITVSSLATRRATVSLKGKTRIVLLSNTLCRKLRAYCRERGITSGPVFVTRSGKPVDRSVIHRRMKRLSQDAGIKREKIFPHNLRHLFAVTYYDREHDIVHLADILGHASINTTRIYTMVTCETQLGILDQIGDVLNPEKKPDGLSEE